MQGGAAAAAAQIQVANGDALGCQAVDQLQQALQRVDGQIEALYAQVRLKGVAKFDSEEDPERRLQLLVNAYAHRQDEAL